ncbi:hypothetical protein YC2023_046404 [Brassica napus]
MGSISITSSSSSLLSITVIPKCGQLGHKATRCFGLPPVPVSKDLKTNESSEAHYPLQQGPNLHHVHSESAPLVETQKPSDAILYDSQGCILLDKEGNDLVPSNMPTQAFVNNTGVNVESPLRHPASVETEAIPLVSSHNSTSVTASTSETLHFPKSAVFEPHCWFNRHFVNICSTCSFAPQCYWYTLSSYLCSDMNYESRLGGLGSNSKPLGDVKGLNMFENIALMDEELASDDVFSPSHSLFSSVDITPHLLFLTHQCSDHHLHYQVLLLLILNWQRMNLVPKLWLLPPIVLTWRKRSCDGRCLKPSQTKGYRVVDS